MIGIERGASPTRLLETAPPGINLALRWCWARPLFAARRELRLRLDLRASPPAATALRVGRSRKAASSCRRESGEECRRRRSSDAGTGDERGQTVEWRHAYD